MTRQTKSTWGGGGTSGKRIPDSEDKPVSKGSFTIPKSQTSTGGVKGVKRLKGAGEEAARATFRRGLMSKALPSSAFAHMQPKTAESAKPMASAKPVQTLGLKKTGAKAAPVAKKDRNFDPEHNRQRRRGFAEAGLIDLTAGSALYNTTGKTDAFRAAKTQDVHLVRSSSVKTGMPRLPRIGGTDGIHFKSRKSALGTAGLGLGALALHRSNKSASNRGWR